MMRALVFVRRSGAKGAGHVGWAFDCGDGTFSVGSIENPRHSLRTLPQQMGFWAVRTADPLAPMRQRAYTEYKLLEIEPASPGFAWRVVMWLSERPYEVFLHNCMDATYDVLRAYGVPDLPVPAHHWEPNHWFNYVPGTSIALQPSGAADSGHLLPQPAPSPNHVQVSGLAHLQSAQPPWRSANTDEWHALQQAMAAAPPMPGQLAKPAYRSKGVVAALRRLLGMHPSA